MRTIDWNFTPEEDAQVEQLLKDIAFTEQEAEERARYGEEPFEPDIDIVITDDTTYITRRRWDGGTV